MGYIDAQGRPEIVMHPDIVRGGAAYRIQQAPAEDAAAGDRPTPTGARRARRAAVPTPPESAET